MVRRLRRSAQVRRSSCKKILRHKSLRLRIMVAKENGKAVQQVQFLAMRFYPLKVSAVRLRQKSPWAEVCGDGLSD